jgi:hypothetical protein
MVNFVSLFAVYFVIAAAILTLFFIDFDNRNG